MVAAVAFRVAMSPCPHKRNIKACVKWQGHNSKSLDITAAEETSKCFGRKPFGGVSSSHLWSY